ncbi:MAG: hypothetical protein IPK32_00270 [Verrucomicrobiaceae bacterium]|nr:hypothetical protein [Verrucomicrobiaceae bacterium]
MSEPNQFRHYQIVQDADGNNVELVRDAGQVAVLAFDTRKLEFVHTHVLLKPVANRAAFESACRTLQNEGHPALARMIEFGEDEGNAFYITSSIDGEPLRSYLTRLNEIPCWLAVMLACRSLETAVAVAERGDYLTESPLDGFRVVQTGPQTVQVLAADFRVLDTTGVAKKKALKSGFEKQAKFLKSFLNEQTTSNVALPDHPVPAADLMELLGSCLTNSGSSVTTAMRELIAALQRLAPEHLSGEIPAAQKPRALLAPLLAGYQEVARGVVNLVRIQSQRLDMANPYSMRGTLTKTGRSVLVEQVPPSRVTSPKVLTAAQTALKTTKKRENTALITVALVNEAEGITCLAEEIPEGISLADLLRERRSIDVQEAYLVLANLDTALTQLDASPLALSKLRLEDIFLLTGFSRDDTRSAKLLTTRLNQWPAFNIMVRAHPTLASMAGRGTDPAALLPAPSKNAANSPSWHGSWLAALAKLLIGMHSPVGVQPEPPAASRERETIPRLLDEEAAKIADASPATRADFLARFARIMQHHDLVKPLPQASSGETDRLITKTKPKTTATVTRAGTKTTTTAVTSALTTPAVAAAEETPAAGFAELLFRTGAADPSPPQAPEWAQNSGGMPPPCQSTFYSTMASHAGSKPPSSSAGP